METMIHSCQDYVMNRKAKIFFYKPQTFKQPAIICTLNCCKLLHMKLWSKENFIKYKKIHKAPFYVSMHTALWCIDVCTPVTSQIITVPEQAPCQWQWHHPPQNTDWHSQLASFYVGMCDRAATFTPSDDLRLTATTAWISSGYWGFLERAVKGPVPFPANFFLLLY